MQRRRTWIAGGIAVAAAGLGALWSARRHASAEGGAAPAPAPADFWSARFTDLQGGELALASLRGRPLVLNFWATWCPPCVKEMPELDRFSASQGAAGWQVLGVAIDQAAAVRGFLDKTPVRFPVALAGDQGLHWVNALGNLAGGLPFTVVFDARGDVIHRKLGPTSHDELTGWAAARPA
jgi:thiol-disulfide isomerase/thioredoxin